MKAYADFYSRAMLLAIAFLFIGIASPTVAAAQADHPDGERSRNAYETALENNPGVPPYISKNTDYIWPINSGTYLSSSFGETRSRHFHAAFDIKTWGRRGYEVYATRDGLLHRIGVSPKGYGKVVYLKHDDGSYSVYAHLMEFARPIKNLVDSLRLADYTFTLNRYLESHNIRFDKGDLIAFSGASGIGPPHLHFELRTPSQKPFNPMLTPLRHRINDTRPPQFKRLAVEPLSPASYVDGQIEIKTYRARRSNSGSADYRFGPIKVSGKVGLGTDVFDPANEVYNAYAVYDLKLMKDEEVLFHSRVDSFSYGETGQMLLDRVYPLLRTTGNGYQRMYLVDGNTLSFYKHQKGKGVLNLPEGRHELRLVASDYYGNQSSAKVVLDVVEPSNRLATASVGDGTTYQFRPPAATSTNFTSMDIDELDSWSWNNDWIAKPIDENQRKHYWAIPIERPSSSWNSSGIIGNPDIRYTGDRMVVDLRGSSSVILRKQTGRETGTDTGSPLGADKDLAEDNATGILREITLHRIASNRSAEIVFPDQQTRLSFDPSTFYDTLSVAFLKNERADSTVFHIMPRHEPLKGSYTIRHIISSRLQQKKGLGFYEMDPEDGELSYLQTIRDGPELRASPKNFGTFTIRADSLQPRINDPRLVHRKDGAWLVRVDVKDKRSGINYDNAKIWCNGRRGIPEYDPEKETISYYHPDFTPQSQNELRLQLSDRAGNSVDTTFIINR